MGASGDRRKTATSPDSGARGAPDGALATYAWAAGPTPKPPVLRVYAPTQLLAIRIAKPTTASGRYRPKNRAMAP